MRFMLKATWKQPLDETATALLPAEEARADVLAEQGILEALYLPADQSGAWSVWRCESLSQVREIARTLPLYPFLDFEITPLED